MIRNLDEKLSYQIGVLAHLLQNQYNEKLAKYDLTVSQARVLYLLREYGTQMQVELQQRLYIQPSTMNGIVESLLSKQFIEKKENELDKRSKIISLTNKGEQIEQQLWEDVAESELTYLKGFSEEELALMIRWLKKMKNNLIDIE